MTRSLRWCPLCGAPGHAEKGCPYLRSEMNRLGYQPAPAKPAPEPTMPTTEPMQCGGSRRG